MSKFKIELQDSTTFENDVLEGTLGPKSIAMKKFYQESKLFSYDPGFKSTASCKSSITFIDGDKSILYYRGYSIEELAKHSDYLEVCYLLLYGELPNKEEKNTFIQSIKQHTVITPALVKIISTFARDAHPMSILQTCTSYLSSLHHDQTKARDKAYLYDLAVKMIAVFPIINALIYRHKMGLKVIEPRQDLSYVKNFLYMTNFGNDNTEIDDKVVKIVNMLLIVHADHEMNASTSVVFDAASTEADPISCLAAGIAALWGPSHGSANEAVLNMLNKIGSETNIPNYIKKAKDKNDPFRLMGFGHRVYKNIDPRSTIIKQYIQQNFDKLNINTNLFNLAINLEKQTLNDSYFSDRKLYSNLDFFSGIIYNAIGVPTDMLPNMFALARNVGWLSHLIEVRISGRPTNIARPRQIYEGSTYRKYPV